MKNILLSLLLVTCFGVANVDASPYFLSEDFFLPTHNYYAGEDGGYVAIYTRNRNAGVYGVGGGIYAMGQIRVQGHYAGRIFIPTGYQPGDNITQDPELLAICEHYYPNMAGQMWVGGDTGGWFGIPL